MALSIAAVGGLADIAFKVIDRVVPDPQAKAAAQLEFLRAQQEAEFKELDARMAAITAEASSVDSWTSRARPTFLYVFYLVILVLVLVAPLVGVFAPAQMQAFFDNVKSGFEAIPEAMWAVFATGYLGYGGYRMVEKIKGAA